MNKESVTHTLSLDVKRNPSEHEVKFEVRSGFIKETCEIIKGFKVSDCSYFIIHSFRSQSFHFGSAYHPVLFEFGLRNRE